MLRLGLAPGIDRPLRLLCVGAHSDDIEIGCGGAVLRLCETYPDAQVRWEVFSATPARALEARQSAGELLSEAGSAAVAVHDFKESYFPYLGGDVKDVFEQIKSEFSPDLVFTHHREDRHQDHRHISDLTWSTFRDHLILEYEVPKYDGDLGQPNCFVALSDDTANRKVEHILKHFRSQEPKQWFSADMLWALLRIRGVESNAPEGFAEAFHCRKAVL